MQPFSLHTLLILLAVVISVVAVLILPKEWNEYLRAVIGGMVTITALSIVNIKFEIIEEVNKVFKRYGVIR
jgi:hypothetical protein